MTEMALVIGGIVVLFLLACAVGRLLRYSKDY